MLEYYCEEPIINVHFDSFTEVGNANFILIHLRNKICSSNLKILSQNKLTYHSGIEDKRLNFYRCLPEKK